MSGNLPFADSLMHDPLLYRWEFPHNITHYPLGFALHLSTNSTEIVNAARQSWGTYTDDFHATPVNFAIGIAGDENGALPPPPVARARRHLLSLISDVANFCMCDFSAGFAYCWFTPPVAHDPAYLRKFFLDPVGYTMVVYRHLAPVHGACVVRKGTGLLLCGPSGAGKSSLSFACARKGWTFVSDDFSYLVRGRDDRIVLGNPNEIRFRLSAKALFPELENRSRLFSSNGEASLELRTSELGYVRVSTRASVDHVIVLKRLPGASPRLAPRPLDITSADLQPPNYVGEEHVRDLQIAELRRLLPAPAHELIYDDLDSAVDCLEIFVDTEVRA
jgi:hypothetical protein